jgi:hypothetical protein
MKDINFENSQIVWESGGDLRYGWYCIEGLYSWGSSLNELIENAYALKINQDGEELGFISIKELPNLASEIIIDFWNNQ